MADDDEFNNDNNNDNNAVDDQYNQQDEGVCKVYDKNDFFTVFVQILLAFLALASLWFKRMTEKPKRLFWTWFADVSKQGVGASYAHVLNMLIASIISQNIRGDGEYSLEDQCAWYGISYLIDTTLGLFLAILFLGLLDRLAHQFEWTSLKNSGVYSGSTALRDWIHQVLAWIVILTITKVIIYVVMWLGSGLLAWMGEILFAPIQGNKKFELVFVMIMFPGILNIFYFWIADGYLKAKDDQVAAHEPGSDDDQKQESLLSQAEKHQNFSPPSTPPPKSSTNHEEGSGSGPHWTSLV
eukprot:CAMPEP_0194049254 /NCGR_PEP_ID=MMETSP0009_2-20130614/30149_1 /TAXON_ID=210454 /ORGANISM="Grammatophora oceanica, Strain CCMP 410" /LENGTH=296 /DNA_ID=CAMNT_0038695363 /DNA_START=166 /DNA_END=1056 /DNA_ORIENTATION=+